jgi:hypothetical protein
LRGGTKTKVYVFTDATDQLLRSLGGSFVSHGYELAADPCDSIANKSRVTVCRRPVSDLDGEHIFHEGIEAEIAERVASEYTTISMTMRRSLKQAKR